MVTTSANKPFYCRKSIIAFVLVLALLPVVGCGKDGKKSTLSGKDNPQELPKSNTQSPESEQKSPSSKPLPSPSVTVNTTRLGGKDPLATAVQIALTAYPNSPASQRPSTVALVDGSEWQTALAASRLASQPFGAPLLFSRGKDLPKISRQALLALKPRGLRTTKRALKETRVVRVGDSPGYGKLKALHAGGKSPAEIAYSVDTLFSRVTGKKSNTVVVVSSDQARYAMPAAGWAAKTGDALLFASRDNLPDATRKAIAARKKPRIYLLGPPEAVGPEVENELRKFGTTTRIEGKTPVENAIAFARFNNGNFGWGITDPGHGLTFVNSRRPLDASAAALLSSRGKYAPLLVVDRATKLAPALVDFLTDIKPGYESDPVRAFYNHGWIVGDRSAISTNEQARIDSLLEIVQVDYDQSP